MIAREAAERYVADGNNTDPEEDEKSRGGSVSQGMHPDRQAMLDNQDQRPSSTRQFHEGDDVNGSRSLQRTRKPKQSGFKKELEIARERKAQFEAKHNPREARERERRAMAKAKRPGRDVKMKLGRQGNVLLSRIKRLTDEGRI